MMERFLRRGSENPPISVLHADEFFVKKILSRNSSVGNCSSRLHNFKTPAEVPFHWESEPGKPKYLPEGDFFSPPPVDPPPSEEARVFHAPPRPFPRATVSQQEKVQFWKKLMEKGQKTVKKVRLIKPASPTAARGRSRVVCRGFHGLRSPEADYHRNHFKFSFPSSSSNFSSSSSINGCISFEGSSKMQSFARGCIKRVFQT